ncbi:hypothetical protein IGB42_02134 [Andreprevotia sp. IGB-42]|nr:hypothetical protein IGB42_02134 [Andreprevotia sp. IGB-42]
MQANKPERLPEGYCAGSQPAVTCYGYAALSHREMGVMTNRHYHAATGTLNSRPTMARGAVCRAWFTAGMHGVKAINPLYENPAAGAELV